MEKKDYKAIAKIIKNQNYINDLGKIQLCEKLSDYFEKEDRKDLEHTEGTTMFRGRYKFDREQFLKDCGVD